MSVGTDETPRKASALTMLVTTLNQYLRRVPAWMLYVLAPLPAAWLLYLGTTGGLGVEPINALERELGEIGLQLLILGLAVTPLRQMFGLNLLKFRRAIGVIAFSYVGLHLLVWLVLDVGILSQIWSDILKRPYITVGMGAFVLLLPLAVTSNDLSIRKLGAARWRKLHKLAYGAALLGGLHFVMLVKGFQWEPLVYLGVTLVLLATRLPAVRVPRLA